VGLLISLDSFSFSFNYVSAFLFDSPFLSDIHPAWCIAFIVSVPSEWKTAHKKEQTQPREQEIHKPLEAEVHIKLYFTYRIYGYCGGKCYDYDDSGRDYVYSIKQVQVFRRNLRPNQSVVEFA
jgi:hypothetical protein